MNQPLLRFLATKNYKNLSLNTQVNLKKLNIFIGSNGSGKSNFINWLKFLKDSLITIPDESRGVSSFENAVAQIGSNRILDGNAASPSVVRFAYCFSDISQNGISGNSGILDLKIYVDKNKPRVSISEEFLYSGEDLHESASSSPFYYYKFHDKEVGKGAVSVYNPPGQNSGTHFEPLDNIHTNSLGLSSIPRLLEYSQYPPESTPVYRSRRNLVEFVSAWQFSNANNMDLNQIRTSKSVCTTPIATFPTPPRTWCSLSQKLRLGFTSIGLLSPSSFFLINSSKVILIMSGKMQAKGICTKNGFGKLPVLAILPSG